MFIARKSYLRITRRIVFSAQRLTGEIRSPTKRTHWFIQRFTPYIPAQTMTAPLSKDATNMSQRRHSVKQEAGLGPGLC